MAAIAIARIVAFITPSTSRAGAGSCVLSPLRTGESFCAIQVHKNGAFGPRNRRNFDIFVEDLSGILR